MRKAIRWIKEKFLIISILAVIYFWGIWASCGLVAGYFFTRYFAGPAEKIRGKMPSLNMIPLGKYRLHLHHWVLATSCLIIFELTGLLNSSSFIFWMGGGAALQGVLCYGDWYKIIYRK